MLWLNFGAQDAIAFAVVSATTVLIIACPCALGLATPMSVMVGVGKAAEAGVLIRNGESLQTASKITAMVLDKTGTITEARPKLPTLSPIMTSLKMMRYNLQPVSKQVRSILLHKRLLNRQKKKTLS